MESIAERKRAVQVGLIVLASAAALAALWLAREIVLLAFLGVLIGVVFSFPVGWLSRVMSRGMALLLVLVGLVGAAVGIAALAAPTLEKEIDQLRESAPRAIQKAQGWVRRVQSATGGSQDKGGGTAQKAPEVAAKVGEKAVPAVVAVKQLESAGFGFGRAGASPGRIFDFDEVKKRTPTDPDLNTFAPDAN